jgi:predicted  nucleic acid-binding Zn-ribbon protein
MGPTNVALVKLFQADQKLREAQGRLDAASKGVRIQERRTHDLAERIRLAQATVKEQQSHAANLDLDLKARDAQIEKLRGQQQNAKNNKEYQAFLVEINTNKVDRGKIEEEALKLMDTIEKGQAELKDLNAQLEGEKSKLATMKAQIGDTVASLQKEIDALRPERESAAAAVPAKAREAFQRLADRFEGEALSAITRPDRRREEYVCSGCMMDLVTDVYNKLHTRDELVFCPNCRRILYIPDDLPPEMAVNKPKERKERTPRSSSSGSSGPAPAASIGRQTSAADVLASIRVEEDEPEQATESPQEPPQQQAAEQPPADTSTSATNQPNAEPGVG